MKKKSKRYTELVKTENKNKKNQIEDVLDLVK